jgi:hypothetical protein
MPRPRRHTDEALTFGRLVEADAKLRREREFYRAVLAELIAVIAREKKPAMNSISKRRAQARQRAK